jgi:hypothetical protein
VTLVLGRTGRDALYHAVLSDLSGVGDIGMYLTDDQPTDAKRLRTRYEQDMRLLDDLGWENDPSSERFDLTMPTATLQPTLERLYWSSAATLAFACEVDPVDAARAREAQRACSELLASLIEHASCRLQH